MVLSLTIFCLSGFCFSDYQEPDESQVTIGGQSIWYDVVKESLCNYIYMPIDYYVGSRGVFRLVSILALGYRNYYEFYLHRRVGDKIDTCLLIVALALIPVNFIYDILEDRTASSTLSNSNMKEIKISKTVGLTSFDLRLSGLLENSALYNISKPLHNLGVSNIKFTSSEVDNKMHLLIGLTKMGKLEEVFFDISFPTLDSDRYHWVELCCNENSHCNHYSSIPLSILSEEVINELVFLLDGNYGFAKSISDFKRVKGVDFSVNEMFVVVKVQQRESDIFSYVICDTQTHTLQLKNSRYSFSNKTLVYELIQKLAVQAEKLAVQAEGWFRYLMELILKQCEHIMFFAITDFFFEGYFLGECAICREAMIPGAVSPASCDIHYFCTSCLIEWAQYGAGMCPYCRD